MTPTMAMEREEEETVSVIQRVDRLGRRMKSVLVFVPRPPAPSGSLCGSVVLGLCRRRRHCRSRIGGRTRSWSGSSSGWRCLCSCISIRQFALCRSLAAFLILRDTQDTSRAARTKSDGRDGPLHTPRTPL